MNEIENTFRTLADKPPLMTSLLCKFGWHDWTQWSKAIQNKNDLKWRQSRGCVSCNKAEVRLVNFG